MINDLKIGDVISFYSPCFYYNVDSATDQQYYQGMGLEEDDGQIVEINYKEETITVNICYQFGYIDLYTFNIINFIKILETKDFV